MFARVGPVWVLVRGQREKERRQSPVTLFPPQPSVCSSPKPPQAQPNSALVGSIPDSPVPLISHLGTLPASHPPKPLPCFILATVTCHTPPAPATPSALSRVYLMVNEYTLLLFPVPSSLAQSPRPPSDASQHTCWFWWTIPPTPAFLHQGVP